MACPFLEYRASDGTIEFDHTRPFCGLAGAFVSPMDADVCGDRFAFHHADHCERYRQHVAAAGEEGGSGVDGLDPDPERARVVADGGETTDDASDAR